MLGLLVSIEITKMNECWEFIPHFCLGVTGSAEGLLFACYDSVWGTVARF